MTTTQDVPADRETRKQTKGSAVLLSLSRLLTVKADPSLNCNPGKEGKEFSPSNLTSTRPRFFPLSQNTPPPIPLSLSIFLCKLQYL